MSPGRLESRLIEMIRRGSHPLEVIPASLEPTPFTPGGSPVKAILFDVYGTLFSSASGDIGSLRVQRNQARQIRELLKRNRVEKSAAQVEREFIAEVKGQHQQLRLKGVDWPEIRYEDIWASVLWMKDEEQLKTFATAYEIIVNPVFPMPGLEELLQSSMEQGLVMGIISNAQFFSPLLFPAFLGYSLEQLGFDPRLLLYSYLCGYAKPSLFMYRDARERLNAMGIKTSEALYIGNDMLKDILPARQVGFRTLLFAGDRRSLRLRQEEEPCRDINPGGIVKDLRQIIPYIRNPK
ncbi:MAG: HAD family hydrolase [bacterium]|nr:HAD family hydrolase [bacterium]